MTTYNTGNPIGSTDPRDLYDNAENLDEAANSSAGTFQDRMGKSRLTWAGMENRFDADQTSREQRFRTFIASSGYQFAGDYATGIEITQYNQLIRDSNGEFWRVSGQVDLPYVTTGAGVPEDDALVPAGDAVLRQDLANPDLGAAMVASIGGNVQDALSRLIQSNDSIDYVQFVNTGIRPERCFVRYESPIGLIFSVVQSNQNNPSALTYVTEYRYIKDLDGLTRLGSIVVGESLGVQERSYTLASGGVTGSWSTAGSNWFTSQVGSTFYRAGLSGNDIYIRTYMDDRGGIWRVEVKDENNVVVAVSEFSTWAGTAGDQMVPVASGLPRGVYSIHGEFIGDDPENPPTGGTSRGWVKSGTVATFRVDDEWGVARVGSVSGTVMRNSVLEFAISAAPVGAGTGGQWVPSHGTVGATVALADRSYVVGARGGTVFSDDYTNWPPSPQECDGIVIQQKYNARNHNEAETDMWSGRIIYDLSRTGLSVTHTIKFLVDTVVNANYMFMMPADTENVPSITATGYGQGYEAILTASDGEDLRFEARKSILRNGGFLSPGRQFHYAATVSSVNASTNFGTPYASDFDDAGLLTDRSDNVSKYYTRSAESGSVIPAGQRWDTTAVYSAGVFVYPL